MVFIDVLSCSNEWDFFLSHFKFFFFHIIGHGLERFKPSNVHVNQQVKIGLKLLC
jgi:hypothetical protein